MVASYRQGGREGGRSSLLYRHGLKGIVLQYKHYDVQLVDVPIAFSVAPGGNSISPIQFYVKQVIWL